MTRVYGVEIDNCPKPYYDLTHDDKIKLAKKITIGFY